MAVSRELLAILACPKCKGAVQMAADESGIICRACSLQYPVREGIPVMLVEEAHALAEI